MVQTPTKPKSQRAVNRQQYNLTKQSALKLSQQPSMPSSPLSMPLPKDLPSSPDDLTSLKTGSILTMSGGLNRKSDWQNLSPEQLMSLSPTELHQMQQSLSPTEAQALYQKLLSLEEMPANSQPSSPSSNKSPNPTTGLNVDSGAAVDAASVPEELQQPLTGKALRRYKDLMKLLALAAGVCVMAAKSTRQLAFAQDAETIGKYGPDVAESWARLSAKYEWLGIGLDWLIGGTEVGLMLFSTGQMLQEIGEHHGVSTPKFNFSAGNVA
jgi:hypothetical protein